MSIHRLRESIYRLSESIHRLSELIHRLTVDSTKWQQVTSHDGRVGAALRVQQSAVDYAMYGKTLVRRASSKNNLYVLTRSATPTLFPYSTVRSHSSTPTLVRTPPNKILSYFTVSYWF
jgi:hypothetical protein